MRLDHLLSKERLQQPAWMYVRVWGLSGSKPVAQAIVLRRVLMGGISTNSGRCVVVSFSSTNPWWFWNGGRGDVVVFVFGTLLGPEATGPGFRSRVCLFLVSLP